MNIFALSGLLIGISSTALAVLMLVIGKQRMHSLWSLFCVSVAIWGFGGYMVAITQDTTQAYSWWRIAHVGVIFIPILFIHFITEFLQQKKTALISTFYLIGLSFLTVNFVGNLFIANMRWVFNQFYYDSPPGILYIPFTFFFFALILYSHFLLWQAYQNAPKFTKTQISYFFLATTVGFTGGGLSFLPVYGMDLYPVFNIAIVASPLVITYAIIKKQLFDIRVVLTQLLVGLITTLLFINFVASKTLSEYTWKGAMFGAFLFAGYLLIKSVLNEIRQREELEKLSKAKSEFMSIASHQLRTPLSVVKGYASLLQEGSFGAVTEKQKEALGKVFKTNEDMINMVNDLLNVTRAEEGRLQYSLEKTDLRELIKIAARAFELTAKQKGLTLEYRLGAEPVPVNADKDKMTQVFSNLIDNAIKYTEKGGVKIDFSIDGKSNGVRVWVADTGPGIGEEEMKHLFESFSRGKAGIKSWTKGTGMGLYIAKQFVEAHKGKIWATSEGEGKGSTFFVELPIQ